MQIPFHKIHGAGNDFVVFDNRQGSIKLSAEQVRVICDRHFGVGADGIIEVRTSPRSECLAYMHYCNADGSLAEMCGNGVRCFARFLVDIGAPSGEEMASKSFTVDTLAGPRPLSFETDGGGRLTRASVIMGEPSFAPSAIPTTLSPTQEIVISNNKLGTQSREQAVVQAVVAYDQGRLAITCVNMGNPHAIAFLEYTDAQAARALAQDPQSIDLNTPGAFLEGNTDLFPQKTNVELVTVSGPNRIRMRVYERGVGETLACGTGACAVAVAAIIHGEVEREAPVLIDLPGGTLEATWLPDNQVLLTGPAKTAFTGILTID